ncbi:MAG: hypothetical protein ACRD7E_17375, partial [Bryobacteraceae bacterium]
MDTTRLNRNSIVLAAAALLLSNTALAHGPEASESSHSGGRRKLAFIITSLYGTGGLTLPNPVHEAHFDSAFQANFGPFNTAIASQLTSLPIPSPASGFTYTFDKSLGVYTRSAQSFGPILAERAETVGKDKFSFGFSYQHFSFDTIDGIDLGSVPSVFQHIPNPTNPEFAEDLITTDNFLAIELGQFTTFFTYGLHDRLDVSVALPMISTSLTVDSDATIHRIGTADNPLIHSFSGSADRRQAQFSGAGSARGIGDVITRLKGTVLKSERAGLAVGA